MSAPAKSRQVDLLNPPSNIDAEKFFLGSILLKNEVLTQIGDSVKEEDFFLDAHRKIYLVMREMAEIQHPIDPVTLSDRLKKKGWDGLTGAPQYIEDLSYIIPTGVDASWYAGILKEKTTLRTALFDAEKLQRAALSEFPEEVERVYGELAKREDPEEAGFTVIRPSIVFSKILPPPVYVLPSLRPRTVGLIIAQEGVGKSFLALEIGLAKATGHDMTGIGVTGPGNVIYFSKEDPPEIIEERLQSIAPFIPSGGIARADGLEIISLCGKKATLVSEKSTVNEKLIRQIIKTGSGKDLLIFDTLRKVHDLEENSSGEMKVLLEIFDEIAMETGAAVLLIHHTNKSANLGKNQGDQSSARGSNAIVGNTRWSLHLEKIVDFENPGVKMLKVSIPRANYGPEGGVWWLERVEGGVLVEADPPKILEDPEEKIIHPKKPKKLTTEGRKNERYY